MEVTDHKLVLDAYWPIIEKARKVKAYYMGENPGEPKRICSDVVGEMIEEIQRVESEINVVKED